MKYNTETINDAAQQLAAMFTTMVIEQHVAGQGTTTIAQIETGMRESLRQIGVQALGLFLSSMQTTPVSEMGCKCGGILKYQRMRPATVISVFGK